MNHPDAFSDYVLETAWVYKVNVLADLVSKRVSEVVAEVSDLSLSQWRVMAALADQPGRTASEVVALTPMDKALVSRAVSSLVTSVLVERRASDQDGRLSHLYLTLRGETVYRDIRTRLRSSGVDGRELLTSSDDAALLKTLNILIRQFSLSPDKQVQMNAGVRTDNHQLSSDPAGR